MKHFVVSIIMICSWFGHTLSAQEDKRGDQAWLISPTFAVQFPGGDLAERFGTNYTVGVGVGFKFPSNFIFDFNAHYIFGSQVKNPEQILAPINTSGGFVLNSTGNYAQINLFERGVYGLLEVQYLFNQFLSVNKNSGPTIGFGGGYIFHWIELDNIGNDSPQVLDDYKKGYDRLSAGFSLKQSIGYTYLSSKRRINFRLSFEVIEAFTTDLRGYNYATGPVDDNRFDLLYGFRLNWYLPIYSKPSEEFYYD